MKINRMKLREVGKKIGEFAVTCGFCIAVGVVGFATKEVNVYVSSAMTATFSVFAFYIHFRL